MATGYLEQHAPTGYWGMFTEEGNIAVEKAINTLHAKSVEAGRFLETPEILHAVAEVKLTHPEVTDTVVMEMITLHIIKHKIWLAPEEPARN